jgi:3-deoxy-D-manno-octulosonic-acid transferase
MVLLYWMFVRFLGWVYYLASFFNNKAKQFINGRKNWDAKLKNYSESNKDFKIWFHCASVGEFEQARPIIEALYEQPVKYSILLTFFSPSGYELRKNYPYANCIVYLPLDSPTTAKKFISLVKPNLAIFIKYEFWHFYIQELAKQSVPVFSVSSVFRSEQIFFKPYGKFYRNILKNITHFFVQDQRSLQLLQSIGIKQITVAGDSRFDRVADIVLNHQEITLAKQFSDNKNVLVAGSVWQEDLDVLIPFLKNNADLYAIIAPHEISDRYLSQIEFAFPQACVRFSKANSESIFQFRILLIDNVGMLSRLYKYGKFAYVGGAFGKGLHNTLEAACYGIPVFFGNKKYKKFLEAKELIAKNAAFAIADLNSLQTEYSALQDENTYNACCQNALQYVKSKTGATKLVVDAIKNQLP